MNVTFPVLAAWATAVVFGSAALVNLAGVGPIREIYERWDIPERLYLVIGLIELVAALLLATPEFRLWGILLAAPIAFGTVVLLLDHGHYFYAAPVAIVLLALGAALFTMLPHNVHHAAILTLP